MAISSNIDQLFAQAVQLHSEGKFPHALQIYEQVLRQEPEHFDALHHTGIAAFQSGNFDVAVNFIRSALAVNQQHAPAHNNLGNALRETQQMEEALRSYDRALALDGKDANTHFNRAVTLQSLLRVDEALQAYEQALEHDAGDDQAWNNRAALLWQSGKYELALINAEQALALNPHNIEALNNQGNILFDMDQAEQAQESYRQALAQAPDYGQTHYNLGRLLLAADRHAEALDSLDRATSLDPQYVPGQRLRAQALHALERTAEAQQAEMVAHTLQRQWTAAYRKRGDELMAQLQYESAAAMYATGLELDKDDAELQQLHANALNKTEKNEQVLGRLREALQLRLERAQRQGKHAFLEHADQDRDYESARVALEKLTKMTHKNPRAYVNLGNTLQGLGLRDQGIEAYEAALAIDPKYAAAQWNLSLMLLARGDFERGWAGYEARWRFKELPLYKFKRNFLKPQWSGRESLQGKTILVYAEQGYGDAIQFGRYLRLIKQRGARVVLEVWQPLAKLMESLEGYDQLVVTGQPLPQFDYQIPMMSLPFAFKTRLDTVPATDFYLRSDPAKRDKWLKELGPKNRPRVGVVWSGSGSHGNDHNRSLPLALLAPIFTEQYDFICLQKEIRAEDAPLLDTLPVRLVNEQLHDFDDTAALCDLMDVVISVDTSVCHLAGALGKPVWILLPTPFEWRWLEHGSTSAWYPSATLYRQQKIGDWSPVITAVAADLKKLLGTDNKTHLRMHTS